MWTVRSSSIRPSLSWPRGGTSSLTADPDPPFVAIWNDVVAELNGDTPSDGPSTAAPRHQLSPPSNEPGSSSSSPWSSPRGLLCCRFPRRSCRTRSNATSASRSSPASADSSASASNSACASRPRPRRLRRRRRRSAPTPADPTPTRSTRTSEALASAEESWPTYFTNRPQNSAVDQRRQPQPSLHLRHLRHRLVEPVRPRRHPRHRRSAGPRLQPAVHLG